MLAVNVILEAFEDGTIPRPVAATRALYEVDQQSINTHCVRSAAAAAQPRDRRGACAGPDHCAAVLLLSEDSARRQGGVAGWSTVVMCWAALLRSVYTYAAAEGAPSPTDAGSSPVANAALVEAGLGVNGGG